MWIRKYQGPIYMKNWRKRFTVVKAFPCMWGTLGLLPSSNHWPVLYKGWIRVFRFSDYHSAANWYRNAYNCKNKLVNKIDVRMSKPTFYLFSLASQSQNTKAYSVRVHLQLKTCWRREWSLAQVSKRSSQNPRHYWTHWKGWGREE